MELVSSKSKAVLYKMLVRTSVEKKLIPINASELISSIYNICYLHYSNHCPTLLNCKMKVFIYTVFMNAILAVASPYG